MRLLFRMLVFASAPSFSVNVFAAECLNTQLSEQQSTMASSIGKQNNVKSKVDKTSRQTADAILYEARKAAFEDQRKGANYGSASQFWLLSQTTSAPRLCELFTRAANDQFLRNAVADIDLSQHWAAQLDENAAHEVKSKIIRELTRTDAENLEWLKADLRENGWYRISTWGREADMAAWLLVQHADQEYTFQTEVLNLLEPLLSSKDTDKQNFAYLFDRVAVNTGKLQRYGTQGDCSGPKRWSPGKIDEPATLDQRRTELEMLPMDEYIAEVSKVCP